MKAGDTAEAQIAYSNFNETAQLEVIVVAHPEAVDGLWDLVGDSDLVLVASLIREVPQPIHHRTDSTSPAHNRHHVRSVTSA